MPAVGADRLLALGPVVQDQVHDLIIAERLALQQQIVPRGEGG